MATSRNNGWEPSGTIYNLSLGLDNAFDEYDEEEFRLFMYILVNDMYLTWDGNYTEKADQIVSENDANNMLESLVYSNIEAAFIDFISKGSFMISSI